MRPAALSLFRGTDRTLGDVAEVLAAGGGVLSLFLGSDRDFGRRLRWARLYRHIDPQETIVIGRLGAGQVVAIEQLDDALEMPVIDLHDEKPAVAFAATIGPVAADLEPTSLYDQLQILTFHSGQFHFDHQPIAGRIHVCVGNPVRIVRSSTASIDWHAALKMQRGTDLLHGC